VSGATTRESRRGTGGRGTETAGATREGRGRDSVHMARALELAARGRGSTSPNPMVGAVLVRDGAVVGEGHHERCGGPHAEVNALSCAGGHARGATLYVTLEPCSVSGKTPPCTEAIVSAGVSRVVVSVTDPNPSVSGRGIELLRSAGIDVDLGLMRDEATKLNAAYFKFRLNGLPFTTLKMALSLDGRIAPAPGGPRWTSSPESRELVHSMRGDSDCVLVGIGTVLADDPRLTDRREGASGGCPSRQPARLVLDTSLRTPEGSALVRTSGSVRTIVGCSRVASETRSAALERAGVGVWRVGRSPGGLDLREVLERAAGAGLLSVLAEGGTAVAGSLLTGGHVDRVAFFVAPRLYGADGRPALPPLGGGWWEHGASFDNPSWTEVGGDCLFQADVVRHEGGE